VEHVFQSARGIGEQNCKGSRQPFSFLIESAWFSIMQYGQEFSVSTKIELESFWLFGFAGVLRRILKAESMSSIYKREPARVRIIVCTGSFWLCFVA
jgi:hypothetical protein